MALIAPGESQGQSEGQAEGRAYTGLLRSQSKFAGLFDEVVGPGQTIPDSRINLLVGRHQTEHACSAGSEHSSQGRARLSILLRGFGVVGSPELTILHPRRAASVSALVSFQCLCPFCPSQDPQDMPALLSGSDMRTRESELDILDLLPS